jgi:hypothetical protein
VPELVPCPDCGLGLQRGRGPHRLAFHECRVADELEDPLELVHTLLKSKALLSEAQVLDALYRLLLSYALTGGTVQSLAEGLEALAHIRKASGGGGGGNDAAKLLLERWTRGPRAPG